MTAIPNYYPMSSLNTPSSSTVGSAPSNAMNKDTFLKLLVAQLKYQDPMKPSDPQEFLAQTASFTQVEKLEEISAQNSDAIRTQGLTTASAMIGKAIKYQNADGTYASGVVTGATIDADGVRLKVGANQTADLRAVTEVGNQVSTT